MATLGFAAQLPWLQVPSVADLRREKRLESKVLVLMDKDAEVGGSNSEGKCQSPLSDQQTAVSPRRKVRGVNQNHLYVVRTSLSVVVQIDCAHTALQASCNLRGASQQSHAQRGRCRRLQQHMPTSPIKNRHLKGNFHVR
jgi:hypothetical protein